MLSPISNAKTSTAIEKYNSESLYKGQVGWVLCPLYSGTSLQRWVLCPLYSGASLQGASWMCYTVEPLFKGQVLIQWSLSTRDKLGGSLSLRLSLIQWSLSTRDKFGMDPLSLIQ